MSYQKNYPNGWQSGEAGGTPITPAALDNMENGIANALPKDGTDPMTADLPMGGHRVTGLGKPASDGDAVPLGYANGHFAPAGYGLGGQAKEISDCHVAESGFYRWDVGCANAPFDFATMISANRYGSSASNRLALCGGGPYQGCIAHKVSEEEWEYFNPPFIPGEQYRTTERVTIDGVTKPVFALEFTTGKMTHGAIMNFHNSDITIVRCEVRCRNHVLPYYGGGDLVGGEWSIWYDISGKTFEARMGSGYTSNNYTVRVWYAD